MGFKNHRGRKDKNHDALIQTGRQIGASMFSLHTVGKSFPDLIGCLSETVLIEVKEPDGQFGVAQLRFLAEWRGLCGFVTNDGDLINLLRFPKQYALSESDKRRILKIVLTCEATLTAKNPRIDVSRFDKLFLPGGE